MKLNQNKAPVYEALQEYRENRIVSFDVPGHKQGKGNPELTEFLGKQCMSVDVNSMKPLDNLCHPVSVIKEAEELMADAFGAAHAFFMVNGTSSSVQAMVMSVCKRGDKIIMPRNVHRSSINALIVCGAVPVYVNPGVNKELGIPLGMSVESVKQAIQQHPDAKAIIVNNPTYYGVCSHLREIVKLAHAAGMKVLVDEAGIRITAGEYVQDDFLDDGIRILIENENPMTCLIDCQLLVVNGYQVGGSFSAQVAAGKKLNTVLEIPRHALRTAEIEEIHSVSAAFAVYDPEPWRTVLKPEEKVIFDDGTKAAEPSDPGTEVFFKEGVHVSARMVRNDPFLGTGIILYLKNEGERTVYAEAKNLSIDGYMLEGYSGTILWPGKRAIGKIYLADGDLAENGITDPREAELYVGLMSAETMEDIVSGTGTFRIG